MITTFSINLNPDFDVLEDYEIEEKNLCKITVNIKNDETSSTGKNCSVKLAFSTDAMLGFGTSLIRKALAAKGIGYDPKEDDEPIAPIINNSPVTAMGIFLAPDSADLIVSLEEFGTLKEVIQRLNK